MELFAVQFVRCGFYWPGLGSEYFVVGMDAKPDPVDSVLSTPEVRQELGITRALSSIT